MPPGRSLRDSDDARYVGLCMPRVLARLPYGAKTEPVDEFAFEEDTDGHKGEKYAWMNAAYAMAANINRAFKEYGWCARIRGVQSGGEVEESADAHLPDRRRRRRSEMSDRNRHQRSPRGRTGEVGPDPADPSQEHRPRRLHRRPVAFQAEGLSEQRRMRRRRAICRRVCPTCSPAAASRTISRCMVRDKVGSYYEKEQLQRWLQQLDQRIRRWRSEEFVRSDQVPPPLAGAKITIVRERGKSRILLGDVRASTALPARGHGHRLAARVAIAGRKKITRG